MKRKNQLFNRKNKLISGAGVFIHCNQGFNLNFGGNSNANASQQNNEPTPNSGGSTGTPDPASNPNDPNAQFADPNAASGNGSDPSQNNNQNNVPNYSDLWETPTQQTQQDPAQPQVVVQAPQDSAEQRLQKHIESLNLTGGIDVNALQAPEDIGQALNTVAANAYSAAIRDANALVTQRMQTFKEEILQQTFAEAGLQTLQSQMYERLPFTNRPEFRPVANAVLQQMLEKGIPQNEVLENVKGYFQNMGTVVSQNQGVNNNSGFSNTNVGAANFSQQQPPKETNWVEFLTGSVPKTGT
jgi:hypothetical protein